MVRNSGFHSTAKSRCARLWFHLLAGLRLSFMHTDQMECQLKMPTAKPMEPTQDCKYPSVSTAEHTLIAPLPLLVQPHNKADTPTFLLSPPSGGSLSLLKNRHLLLALLPGWAREGTSLVVGHSVVSNSVTPWTRRLCSWNFPGKNTGVGWHSLLLGIFPTQALNLGCLHCWQILYWLSHQGSELGPISQEHPWCHSWQSG